MDGVVAQLVERLVRNEKVRGSTPLGSTSPSTFNWQRFSRLIIFRNVRCDCRARRAIKSKNFFSPSHHYGDSLDGGHRRAFLWKRIDFTRRVYFSPLVSWSHRP